MMSLSSRSFEALQSTTRDLPSSNTARGGGGVGGGNVSLDPNVLVGAGAGTGEGDRDGVGTNANDAETDADADDEGKISIPSQRRKILNCGVVAGGAGGESHATISESLSEKRDDDEEEAIRVAVRLKPLSTGNGGSSSNSDKTADKGAENASTAVRRRAWRVLPDRDTIVLDHGGPAASAASGQHQPPQRRRSSFGGRAASRGGGSGRSDAAYFAFDRVFGEECTTRQVYDGVCRNIVSSVVERGVDGTCFAYGQTSSGKTHTMRGGGGGGVEGSGGSSEEEEQRDRWGVVQLAASDVFDYFERRKSEAAATVAAATELVDHGEGDSNDSSSFSFSVKVSFMEIYNEEVRDLVAPSGNHRDDAGRGGCNGRRRSLGGGGAAPGSNSRRRSGPPSILSPSSAAAGHGLAARGRGGGRRRSGPPSISSPSSGAGHGHGLAVREDRVRGVFVEGLSEHEVTDLNSVVRLLRAGESHRSVGGTDMNERSSRSHTVFRMIIEQTTTMTKTERQKKSMAMKDNDDNDDNDPSADKENVLPLNPVRKDAISTAAAGKLGGDSNREVITTTKTLRSTLNLVDLAGSESVRNTNSVGMRKREGGKINQSLLTLSRVFMALGQNSSDHRRPSSAGGGGGGKTKQQQQQQQFVNYRDSKLTRILQSSLSGNARMAIICCANLAESYIEETRTTLQFASRAKLVKTRAKANEIRSAPHGPSGGGGWDVRDTSVIRNLQREIGERSREALSRVTSLKEQLKTANSDVKDIAAENEELSREIAVVTNRAKELERKVAGNAIERDDALAELKDVKEQHEHSQQRVERMSADKENLVKQLTEKLEATQREAAYLRSRMDAASAERDAAYAEIDELREQTTALHSELSSLRDERKRAEERVRELGADKESSVKLVDELVNERDGALSLAASLERQLIAAKSDVSNDTAEKEGPSGEKIALAKDAFAPEITLTRLSVVILGGRLVYY